MSRALPSGLVDLPTERADRALGLLRLEAIAKIKNATLSPNWLDDTHFWYQREGDDGAAYVVVDARTGDSHIAFNSAAVAAALSAATQSKVSPGKLPLAAITRVNEGLVATFKLGDKCFAWPASGDGLRQLDPPITRPEGALLGPGGRLSLFVRNYELWIHDARDASERQLTQGGGPNHGFALTLDWLHFNGVQRERQGFSAPPPEISWSPCGRRLIASFSDQRAVEPLPLIEQAPRDGSVRPRQHELRVPLMGERPPTLDFQIIDVDTGAHRPIDLPPYTRPTSPRDLIRFWWSDDGERAFVLARDQDFTRLWLIEIDPSTGVTRVVISDDTMPLRVFGEGGGSPPAVAVLDSSDEFIWLSCREGWHHLFLHELSSGAVKSQLTTGDWLIRELVHVDQAQRTAIFIASGREPGNPYHRYIYKVGLDTGEILLLTPEPGDHKIVSPLAEPAITARSLSPSGGHLVYGVSSVADPGDFRLRRVSDGGLVGVLETVNAAALFKSGYRPPEEVTATAADGESILHGVVYRPSDYDPRGHYPIIDMQYGSPIMAVTPRNFLEAAANVIGFTNCAAMAELGFVVIVVDARGTPGRNDAFSRPKPGYLAHMGLDDHIAFIRQVAASEPALDLDRIGISGISFGGWTTFRALLGYPDVFKVGVSGAGPGSFQSMWIAAPLVLPHGPMLYGVSRERPTPTAIPDAFKDIDNLAQAYRMQGRLLIVVGEHDENVPAASTLQFYDALLKHDRDVDLVYVANGSHGGIYSGSILRRECNFFLEHLAGARLPKGVVMTSPIP